MQKISKKEKYKGERIEYKIDCECRKPKVGMLKQAAIDYNINLQQSYIIGDSFNDILLGKNASIPTIYVGQENLDGVETDYYADSLTEAVDKILENS